MARPVSHGEFSWPKPRPKAAWKDACGRRHWFKRMFIDHPGVRELIEDAWSAVDRAQQSAFSVAMLILAGSGAGKTQLAEEFKAQLDSLYGRKDPQQTVVPAIILKVPERCTPRDFCLAILQALDDAEPERRPRKDLTGQTATMLKACETRAVIIDNVQDIPTKRGVKGVEQVGIRLRELIDQSQCLWLLLGTDAARSVVDSEAQLIKRVAYRARIPYFKIATTDEQATFLKLLLHVDKWLPLMQDNQELLRKQAGHIFVATEGILDRLAKLLDLACVAANKAGREYLVQADLRAGFRVLYGPQVENPFADGFVLRQLRNADEPFEKLNDSPPLAGKVRRRREQSAKPAEALA